MCRLSFIVYLCCVKRLKRFIGNVIVRACCTLIYLRNIDFKIKRVYFKI